MIKRAFAVAIMAFVLQGCARCGMDASTARRRIDDRQRPKRGSGRDRLRSAGHGCRSHWGVAESSQQPEGMNLEERASPLKGIQALIYDWI